MDQFDPGGQRAKNRRVGIDVHEADPDALAQFGVWYDEWRSCRPLEPSTVALATHDPERGPSIRLMRLAGLDHGFVFFTDARSRKAVELTNAPRAALCFDWAELARQVKVSGAAARVSEAEVEAAFRAQVPTAQLLAQVSDQCSTLGARSVLEAVLDDASRRLAKMSVPRPTHWLGFRLIPDEIEFWQARVDGLADRLRYTRGAPSEKWRVARIAP